MNIFCRQKPSIFTFCPVINQHLNEKIGFQKMFFVAQTFYRFGYFIFWIFMFCYHACINIGHTCNRKLIRYAAQLKTIKKEYVRQQNFNYLEIQSNSSLHVVPWTWRSILILYKICTIYSGNSVEFSIFIQLLVYISKNIWKILQNELDMSKRLDWLFVFMLSPRKRSQKQQLAQKVEALRISYFTFCFVILYPDIKTVFHIFNKWIVEEIMIFFLTFNR